MKFLNALWTNMVRIFILLFFIFFPFTPILVIAIFDLSPYFVLLIIPLAITEFIFIDCYAAQLKVFLRNTIFFQRINVFRPSGRFFAFYEKIRYNISTN